MKGKNIKLMVIGIVAIIAIYVVYQFFATTHTAADTYKEYVRRIKHKRKEIEDFMENSPESPFSSGIHFRGLSFFQIDTAYQVKATVEYLNSDEIIAMATSDKKNAQYIRWAKLSFFIQGKPQSLTVFKSVGFDDNSPFLPFTDLSNGKATYELGRYLNVNRLPPKSEGNTYILDFNLAYNPYCTYSSSYSCPIPPQENQLTAVIKVGEKKYVH